MSLSVRPSDRHLWLTKEKHRLLTMISRRVMRLSHTHTHTHTVHNNRNVTATHMTVVHVPQLYTAKRTTEGQDEVSK